MQFRNHLAVFALAISTVAVLSTPPSSAAESSPYLHHDLHVRFDPASHRLEASDTILLPGAGKGGDREVLFLLHPGLNPKVLTEGVRLEQVPGKPDPATFGLDEDSLEIPGDDDPEVYRLTAKGGGAPPRKVEIAYAGLIHHPPQAAGEEYAQSFSQTPGTIQEEGVFLSGSTFWYPRLNGEMVTFTLEVSSPEGWDAVSEGTRAVHESGRVRWESPDPVDDIFLCAGRFTVYQDQAGAVTTYAYLRSADEALARKYLDTAAAYLEMYRGLLGRYPYGKFALVENFWETGYGMPSFTLLGPRIIRFPFILHSSYPHEILHNWWGNGVFVRYETGNWCEGLTAYLADHLIKEQRGQGAAYRRDQLQKVADFVRDEKDFPLTEFRSRHSGATQAIGYGKTAMMFHMLRRELGDETFVAGLRRLYKDNLFRKASFDDVREAFEKVSGTDLGLFFRTWVTRTGAPSLRIKSAEAVAASPGSSGAALHLVLEQVQEEEPYPLLVEVAVTMQGKEKAHVVRLPMEGRILERILPLEAPPVRVQVDPGFDLYRRLDRKEIPPSFGQAFGAGQAILVLPSQADPALLEGYRELADMWKGAQAGTVTVVLDSELEELPGDRAAWIFGWDNRFRSVMSDGVARYGAELTGDRFRNQGEALSRRDRSVVTVVSSKTNPDLAIGFLGADNPAALPGLGRKLPHYGKYGYLAFEGDEPANVYKGTWPAVGSPLDLVLDGGESGRPAGVRPVRKALATLPPVFSEKAMRKHAAFLASDALEGRGCGSAGLEKAARYIEERFRKIGLAPGGEDGGYRRAWKTECGDEKRPATQVNLVGVLPGSNPKYEGESVVVIAHYDHLGYGWPSDREEDKGQIFNGADDNASGVAVLLELARVLAAGAPPERTLLFLAVSGEEIGLLGSREYVKNPGKWPLSKIIGVLNIDTVGRLGDRPLLVLGAGSADEWRHIVFGAGYVTGVKAKSVQDDGGASDQKSFLDAGVPAVQFFSGPQLDYHRPSDDLEKLDYAGLVKTAAFIKEFVDYLAARETPLTSRLEPTGAVQESARTQAPRPKEGGRRVSLGTVPDFAWEGEGVRITGVVPGSPAAGAGLVEGDVVVELAGKSIGDLRALSQVLKSLAPGDTATLVWKRNGERQEAEVTLKPR